MLTDQQIDEFLELIAKSPTSARDMVRGLFAKAAPAITLEKLDALIHAYSDWQGYIGHGSGDCYNQIEEQKHNTYLRLRAELLDAAPSQPAVPQGWKLVPVEMTDEMRDAGNEFICNRWLLKSAYAAMLAATPAAPSQPVTLTAEHLDELRRALCLIRVVTELDGFDLIRRTSVLDIVDARIAALREKE